MKRARAFLEDMLRYARLAVDHGTGYTPDQLESDVLRYLGV